MKIQISHLILRKDAVKSDQKLKKEGGRRVLVSKIYTTRECPATNPEWAWDRGDSNHVPVVETGYGGLEVSTFNQLCEQECHRHFICTEIYTVLEGKMTIKIEDNPSITLDVGDEIIVFPGIIHEVVTNNDYEFLTRVHSINCYGDADKYICKWVQKRVPDFNDC